MTVVPASNPSRSRLLNAALKVIRTKGYSATRIEDVCLEAGLTKGSFFHHFKSKDDLAHAAVALWDENGTRLFAAAPYHDAAGPLERLLAYVEFRKALLTGDLSDFTCLAGTIVQEAYLTHPDLTVACAQTIGSHAMTLEIDIREAMRDRAVVRDWTAGSLALHIQSVIQGAFVIAKARGEADAAIESLDHLARYLKLLFAGPGDARR